ncbi:MAG: hypothetical protein WB987_00980, partial [Candidatus Acidiferrales bacterium]
MNDVNLKAMAALLTEKGLGEPDGNAEIRAAETFEDSVSDADHFSLAIKERAAGTAGGGLSVEYNFVGENVANVALCDERTNQVATRELVQNLRNISIAMGEDLLRG